MQDLSFGLRLALGLALLLGASSSALAAGALCSDYTNVGTPKAPRYVVDGFAPGVYSRVASNSTFGIDADCTIRNFPQSIGGFPIKNINFNFPGQQSFVIVFDNVYYAGGMSCNDPTFSDFWMWWTNGSFNTIDPKCQAFMLPVDAIKKVSPAATAAIGVPFDYTLTFPMMMKLTSTGYVYDNPVLDGQPLSDVHVYDDLTKTGAALSYVGNKTYIRTYDPVSGALISRTQITSLNNLGDSKHLHFYLANLPAYSQLEIELKVVLDGSNTAGTIFTNTATWTFDKTINGIFKDNLPGQNGISEPMTVVGPDLVVDKSSTVTNLNVNGTAPFKIDVQNTGTSAAWNPTVRDVLPSGMCLTSPLAGLSAQIFAADGITPASGILLPNVDYGATYSGCTLEVTLKDTHQLAPGQRLVVKYDARFDPGTTPTGSFTNVAGATQWYNDVGTNATRKLYGPYALTDGTPGTADFQDAYTVNAAVVGYYLLKSVENVTTGAVPALNAYPGDRLRYTLQIQNFTLPALKNISIEDDLGALNPPGRIVPGSLALVSSTLPATATLAVDPNGGTNGAGLITINNLNLPSDTAKTGIVYQIQFDVIVATPAATPAKLSNQAKLLYAIDDLNVTWSGVSDDPYVGGPARLGDTTATFQPTDVVINKPGPLSKATTQATAAIGQQFTYTIKVPAAVSPLPLYDVRVTDDLAASAADLRYVSARWKQPDGSWRALSIGGSATAPVLYDAVTGIDVVAGGQAEIEITVELLNTLKNQDTLGNFVNTATYTFNRANGVAGTQANGEPGTSGPMSIVEPKLAASKSVQFRAPAGKATTEPAMVGDVLEYVVTLTNNGTSTAHDLNVADTLPPGVALDATFTPTATIGGTPVSGFKPAPTLIGAATVWGRGNGDDTLDVPAGQSLVLTYRVAVTSVTGAPISNSVYTDWTSLDAASAAERTGAGCPSVTAPNDYCVGPTVSPAINTLDNTLLTKAATADTYAEPVSGTDPIVRVGDTVTYELTLNLQEYTTRNVVVSDVLPQGMALDSAPVIVGTGFTYTKTPATIPAGTTGALTWDFGDITNPPSNDGTPTDKLVIRYVAKVVTAAAPTGVDLSTSLLRDNTAKLSYTGSDPANSNLTASERINVRQPLMGAISKVDLGSGRVGTGTAGDPYRVSIATDVMKFQLQSCNTGLAPAYGVVITDTLAAQLDETDLATAPPVVKIGTTTLAAGTDYAYVAPGVGGTMRFTLNKAVDPGQCVTVTYDIGFHSNVAPNSTWSNLAKQPQYESLDALGAGRLYSNAATAQVWMTNAFTAVPPLKTLLAPASGEAVVGQEVTYEITVPSAPVNAALDNVVITDTLDARLKYTSFTQVSGPAVALTSGSNLEFKVAQIPAGQQVKIQVKALVDNIAATQAGSVPNTVSYTYGGVAGGSSSATLRVVEPVVNVTKTVPPSSPKVGDVLDYTLKLAASGGVAGDIYSDANDVSIKDTLGVGLAYVTGTAKLNGGAMADPTVTVVGGQQVLTWNLASIAEGTTPVVTYQVKVVSASAGQILRNDVRVEWTSIAGANANERTGTGTATTDVNNYFDTAFTELTTPLTVTFAKSVVNKTTGQDPGANATPGDVLHYKVELTNTSVTPLNNVRVEDVLAPQFAPNTLQSLTVSDTTAVATSNATGGANGTGIVDVQMPTLGAGATLTIEFDATLAAVIQSGTTVLNQASLTADKLAPATSNQTATLIGSAPRFEVLKTSQDMTGDPSVLLAGDTLRYTITVKNVGTENATGVSLRDVVPVNTTYVAGSTRLNGTLLADAGAGVSPLQNGLALGNMTAVSGAATNVATVTFDVRVNSGVADGTILSNQGFVGGSGAGSGPFADQPSDDPATTSVPDDPTRDIVGRLPLLDATKTVTLVDQAGTTPGSVDPLDTLHYTITVNNFGAIPASDVRLTDAIPAGTSYVAGTVKLNGVAVADPGLGISALEGGMQVGPVAAGASVVVTFDVQVKNDGTVQPGDVISNQGYVASPGLATEPTDADGNDANGDQPTIVVVGSAQQLAIVKQVIDVNGGAVQPGDTLEYVVRVTNTGTTQATSVVVTDDLAQISSQATYVTGSATLNGSATGVSVVGTVLTTAAGSLQPGASTTLRFKAVIVSGLAVATRITNTAQVAWNSPKALTASVSVDVGAIPGTATLSGHAWHDANFDNLPGAGEANLAGWTVALWRNNVQLGSVTTDAGGLYSFSGVAPSVTTADQYELRFSAPGATATTAKLGLADSAFTNGMQQISAIVAVSGSNVQNLNLPIDPNGVVFDSITRAPIAGATLTMVRAGSTTALPASCFDDPVQQNQVTLASGFYKFDLNYSDASCPLGGDYVINVTPPGSGYVAGPSRIIPPVTSATTAAFSVPSCSPDAVSTTANCEAMASASAPGAAVQPAQISHYLHLTLGDPAAGDNQLFNNHIAVDRSIAAAFTISKTSSLVNVSRGQLVPYTITINNTMGAGLTGMSIVDTFPPGFKYVEGSSRIDGVAVEPARTNRNLTWSNLQVANGKPLTIKLLFIVGSGVSEGDYVNRAQVFHPVLGAASAEATATVRVVPDPNFDCTDIIGKVFDDANRNGAQDQGEKGLPGVRVVTAQGLLVTTDDHGRFHVTCAVVPDENRGSNFILKVDDRTLPTGYRITTENPRVQRVTRGKMAKFNFGATIHKVVRIDVANGVFEPGTTEMRLQWKPRMDLLMGELKKSPSTLRLAYMAEVEDEKLVDERLKTLKQEIADLWARQNGPYELVIETEVFWRTGAPPSRSALK